MVDEMDPLDAYMASLELPADSSDQVADPATANASDSAHPHRWRPSSSAHSAQEMLAKNRRYRRLQQLLHSEEKQEASDDEDAYFSDAMMQHRSPALFHFYLGQYFDQRAPSAAPEDSSLSSFLLSTCERSELESRRVAEQAQWEMYESSTDRTARKREQRLYEEDEQEKEEEEDTSSDEEDMADQRQEATPHASLTIDQRRQQLVEVMGTRFLDGLDGDYVDYAAIDGNEALDDVELMDRDAEERYFDADQ